MQDANPAGWFKFPRLLHDLIKTEEHSLASTVLHVLRADNNAEFKNTPWFRLVWHDDMGLSKRQFQRNKKRLIELNVITKQADKDDSRRVYYRLNRDKLFPKDPPDEHNSTTSGVASTTSPVASAVSGVASQGCHHDTKNPISLATGDTPYRLNTQDKDQDPIPEAYGKTRDALKKFALREDCTNDILTKINKTVLKAIAQNKSDYHTAEAISRYVNQKRQTELILQFVISDINEPEVGW